MKKFVALGVAVAAGAVYTYYVIWNLIKALESDIFDIESED